MNKFDTVKYLSKSAVAFGLFAVYDVFVEGREFSGFGLRDGATFALSTVAAEWSADLLNGFWNMNESSVSGMITKPLLNGIFYMYLFNYFVRPEYEGSKDNTSNFVMAAFGEVLLSYIANPLTSLFGGYHSYN
jgi:hypothetical protein